ncbi:MAG: MMPL family transporter [Solirubrobacterales bacterium]
MEGELQPTSLTIPGTASARGQALAERHFGNSSPFAILLKGPAPSIERQGPRLVAALRREPDATVLSPWDRGRLAALRPGLRRALILVDFHVPLAEAMRHTVPALEKTLADHVHPPLRAIQSGYASVSRALQEESLGATERAELIAAPLLIIVLLLVFRSVIAAAIPLVMGALTVLAGRGVLVVLGSFVNIDALSLVVCTMMGLALGVDYSLFIVSRFREELDGGSDPAAAALRTRQTAGRTTVFAGVTLFAAIFLSSFLQPGSLLFSLATALVVVTVISVAIAWLALPALLAMLGPRIDSIRIGAPRRASGKLPTAAAFASAALRRPALAVILISIPLLLLAGPALAVSTGAPGVSELSASNSARKSTEEIDSAVGPGWEAPFILVAEAPHGPITTPRRLALLASWQRHIASEAGVRTVIGPGQVVHAAAPLRRFGQAFTRPGGRGPAGLTHLGPGLLHAATAVGRLRSGIARAAQGSGLLGIGAGRAGRGAGLLAGGLGTAVGSGTRAVAALPQLKSGTRRLATGQRKASAAGFTLALGLRSLLPTVRGNGLVRARRLEGELKSAAHTDPSLQPEATQAAIVLRALENTHEELQRLSGVANDLNGGLERLSSGGKRLEGGTKQLSSAASGLVGGLQRLEGGARRLEDGLSELDGGAGALQRGLSSGYRRSHPLQSGLHRAGVRVSATVGPLAQGARRLRRSSPHLFESGYFVLSALEGASHGERALAGEAVDLGAGGQAARMLVVSNQPLNSAGSRAVGARLLSDAERLGRAGDMRTGVSGGGPILNDYGTATKARLPLVIGTVILITFLVLVAILRALPLAALAVMLNLGSVAAAVGVITLVAQIPAGYPLGGHPYIDTVGAAGIFAVTFGLSIDYAVFLLARIRERYERDGDNAAAIAFGLERTASVITGAAAIMAAVFISFATAPIATVSQMGLGLTVAILLDATVVRIVLLPALMLLLGDRVWWLPAPLDQALPRFNVHGHHTGQAGDRVEKS